LPFSPPCCCRRCRWALQEQENSLRHDLKQLALAAAMYNADNEGRLAENYPQVQATPAVITNNWISGNMRFYADATNVALVRASKFFPYANNAAIYHCPADSSGTNGRPRTRSYSMNSWWEPFDGGRKLWPLSYLRAGKRTERGRSGKIWVIADEDERRSMMGTSW